MVEVDPINEYLLEYRSIKRWLRNFSGDTPRTYLNDFRYWFEWVRDQEGGFKGCTPDDLIHYQAGHRDYVIVDLVIDYLNEVKQGLTTNTITRRDSVVKSFFKHNRAALPEDVYRVQGDVASTPGTLSRLELKQVILASNPLYRAVFSCMYAGFMGWGELEYWSNNGYLDLVEQREKGKRIIVAWQSGRKQYAGIPFYNLIGGDAVDLLRIYLENHREPGAGPIFKTQRSTPLIYDTVRYYWIRKLDKLGFIDRTKGVDPGIRYGKNLHEIRDLARTEWSRSKAKPMVAEFMMGHRSQLDPNEYNKVIRDTGWSKREYRKALPYLNILSEDPTKISLEEHESELEHHKSIVRKVQPFIDVLEDDPSLVDDFRALIRERKRKLQEPQS